jgi:hypothetical protein
MSFRTPLKARERARRVPGPSTSPRILLARARSMLATLSRLWIGVPTASQRELARGAKPPGCGQVRLAD